MADAMPTAKYRLAEHLLGSDLRTYVQVKRRAGRPWRRIASDLLADTNGEIDVTVQTLFAWFPEIRGSVEAPTEAAS